MKTTNKKIAATVAVVMLGVIAIAAPIAFAVYQARKLSLDTEIAHALAYARDVLHRTDSGTDQIASGIDQLLKAAQAPCSDEEIALMRRIDLTSSYIKTIGRVAGDRIICSSYGRFSEGLPLGPIDGRSPNGTSIRANVSFPFAPGVSFVVAEREGYAAVIHKTLPIDATTQRPDIILGVYSRVTGKLLSSRGAVRLDWLAAAGNRGEAIFRDRGYIVAVVRSQRYYVSAVAAIPETYLMQEVRAFSLRLVPVGLIGSLILALAVFFLARRQLSLPAVIRTALKNNEFFLVYQPVVDLRSGRWVGAEALIRWQRPNGELMRPDLFIAVAEEAGLVQRITGRVLEMVERDACELFQRFPDFHLGINFAPVDLQSPDSVDLIRGLAQRLKTRPESFMIEATERVLMKPDLARDVVKQMRACGVRIAIDDFGTGYSSLSYLETFELDYLKIDKSFVDTIGSDAATSQVVLHIIEMAKALKLEMIAEGIETEEQAQFLREREVQFGQGWLYAKPMSMDELMVRLAEHEKAGMANAAG